MDKAEVKFGEWFEKGFNLYKENIGTLILASLIALVISAVTVGILAGPMLAGIILITLNLFDKKEPKPQVGSVFKGFDYFLNALLFVIIWAVAVLVVSFLLALIPCIGQVASLLLVYVVQTFLMFWPASMESFNIVKTNFWPFLGLSVVTSIIGSIGAIACGLGVAVTAPIQVCILTVAYRDVFSGAEKSAVTNDTPVQDTGTDTETDKAG